MLRNSGKIPDRQSRHARIGSYVINPNRGFAKKIFFCLFYANNFLFELIASRILVRLHPEAFAYFKRVFVSALIAWAVNLLKKSRMSYDPLAARSYFFKFFRST